MKVNSRPRGRIVGLIRKNNGIFKHGNSNCRKWLCIWDTKCILNHNNPFVYSGGRNLKRVIVQMGVAWAEKGSNTVLSIMMCI